MAYAPTRSCSAELREGATDGSIRKPAPNRGGGASSPSNVYPGHVMAGVLDRPGGGR
ncbi:hypothetical protein ACWDTT_16020 [Streptosporangium sandarakinum]